MDKRPRLLSKDADAVPRLSGQPYIFEPAAHFARTLIHPLQLKNHHISMDPTTRELASSSEGATHCQLRHQCRETLTNERRIVNDHRRRSRSTHASTSTFSQYCSTRATPTQRRACCRQPASR